MIHELSAACERNKAPILRVIAPEFARDSLVLEIGSGTGQHALYFSSQLPEVIWQPSDTLEYLPGLRELLAREGGANLKPPLELDVREHPWPIARADGIFSANTLHIMGWASVQEFFRGVGAVLAVGGALCVYGPFRYSGAYTSESNAAFDEFLRGRDPRSGIRDFEQVDALARGQGLTLTADHAMPANNQTLVWRRVSPEG